MLNKTILDWIRGMIERMTRKPALSLDEDSEIREFDHVPYIDESLKKPY